MSFWLDDAELTPETYHLALSTKEEHQKQFLLHLFNQIISKQNMISQQVQNMQASINKDEALATAFTAQGVALTNLQNTIANASSLSAEDADAIASAQSKADAETAKIAAILNPPTPAPSSVS